MSLSGSTRVIGVRRPKMRGFQVALFCVISGIVGCSADDAQEPGSGQSGRPEESAPTKTTSQASHWSCETEGSAVVCTAPMALSEGETPAYACNAGESSDKCPDQQSVDAAPGLDVLIQGKAEAFAQLPWACLTTGGHQSECVRDLGGASDGAPSPPEGTCDAGVWQTYFAAQASFEFQSAGVDITFPPEIFDSSQSMVEAALDKAKGMMNGGVESSVGAPSCHAAEWSMRRQSWLDVVLKGCAMQLAMANTVWCQQAANYAPTTGKCTATGSW